MARQCPVGMENIPEMQEIYGWYPEKDRNYLNNAVLAWQEYREVSQDTFPNDRRTFSIFLSKTLPRLTMTADKSERSRSELLDKYLALYNTFTPQQLQDRVEMLARDFSDTIDEYMGEHPLLTRDEAIRKLGGVKGIFRRVKYNYDFSSAEELIEFDMEGMPESKREAVTRMDKEAFPEYRKIVDNFNQLAALACNILVDTEGIKTDYSGIELDIENGKEDEADTEKEATGLGDRYVDSRIILQEDTLSIKVKRLIRSIPRRKQNNGNPDGKTAAERDPYVRDEMYRLKFMNPIEIHTTLLRIISKSTSDTFMQDIRDNISSYPWLKDLYDKLVSDPEMRTEVFCAYSRDEARYISLFGFDKNNYHTSIENRADTRSEVMNIVRKNLRGLELDSTFKTYDSHGAIVMTNKEASDAIDIVSKLRKDFSLYWSPKDGDSKYDAYRKAVNESSAIPVVADMLRGIGFDISEGQLRTALLVKSASKFDQFNSMTRWAAILRGIGNIYNSLTRNKHASTGENLLINNSSDFDIIARAVKPGFADDVESRVVKNGKAFSTYQNRTLIRQILKDFKDFANELKSRYPSATGSKAERKQAIESFITEKFGKYEGYRLKDGKIPGIKRFIRIPDNSSSDGGKAVDVFDFTEFNGKEYADMSSAEKLLASFMMFRNGYFEVPIQADYNVNYFINFGRTTMNDIMDGILDEVKLEINRIEAITGRLDDNDRITIDTYDGIRRDNDGNIISIGNGIKFQSFPEFNTNGFLERYRKVVDENPSNADGFITDEVRKQLDKILSDDTRQAESDGLFMTDPFKDTYSAGKWKDEKMKNEFAEYSISHFYYQILMSRVIFGGKAFFKNTEDSEKRQMMAHAPVIPLDTNAEWSGKRVGKDSERVVYVNDSETASVYMGQINGLLTSLQKDGYITEQ